MGENDIGALSDNVIAVGVSDGFSRLMAPIGIPPPIRPLVLRHVNPRSAVVLVVECRPTCVDSLIEYQRANPGGSSTLLVETDDDARYEQSHLAVHCERFLAPTPTSDELESVICHSLQREARLIGIRQDIAWASESVGRLTTDLRQILDCVCRGLSNKQAAKRLGLSIRGVEARRSRLLKELNASTVAEVIATASLSRLIMVVEPAGR